MPRNFGHSTVVTAPSPATSGLSLTVAHARFTTGPAVLCPDGADPTPENAEIVEISAVVGTTLTLSARAQEGTTARTVAAGWRILQGVTAAMYADLLSRGTLVLDDSSESVLRVDIPDDGTPTAGWPDRLEFRFEDEAGVFIRTGYFNEYGELRARSAKDNTVALRVMAHAENTNAVFFELADADQTETYLEASKVGVDAYVPVSAPNISVDKIKTANLTVNNTTSPQSDPHLTVDLDEAGATYVIEGVIQYEATQAADMRMRLVFTNDPTSLIVWSPVLQSGATSATNSVNVGARTANTNFTAGGIGAGSPVTMGFIATVVTNLATTLTLAFAQATQEVSDVIVYAGSRMSVRLAKTS